MVQVVLPSIFIVVLSYASFFISRPSAPARVALPMLAVLTLWNMIASVRANLPKSRGTGCLLLDFLFGSSIYCLYSMLVRPTPPRTMLPGSCVPDMCVPHTLPLRSVSTLTCRAGL